MKQTGDTALLIVAKKVARGLGGIHKKAARELLNNGANATIKNKVGLY
jgi:hypothetical protein